MSDKPTEKTLEERVADLEEKVKSLVLALSQKLDVERYNKEHPLRTTKTRSSR